MKKSTKKIKKNTIKNFFKGIGHKIDKFIIVPITKFFLSITKIFNKNGKYIEKWMSKKNTLVFISLLMALATFFIVDNKSVMLSETSAEVIYNQPVNAIYNKEAYVVEGLPDKVDITLIGRKSDLYLARQLSTHDVAIDLSDLKPGTHKVNLKYRQSLGSIDYKLDPSVATVIIYPKKSNTKNVTIDVLNDDKLDEKLFIQEIKSSTDEVYIKGAEHVLNKVATVKALLDVNNIPNPEVGDIEMKDIPLKAYDESGNIIDVEIVPSKINATIKITSPSKELPIKIIPKGTVIFGQAISTMTSDVSKITVYGDEKVLETLNYIPIEIDVNDLKANKEYSETIKKPNGIRAMSVNTINIKVTLEAESSKEIQDVRIKSENLASGLVVNAASAEDIMIPVIVKGVSSVINSIDASSINASIDLSGYGEGEHEIEVKVTGSDERVTYTPKTKKVKIIIKKL